MHVSRIFELLEVIEDRFPVAQWELGGIRFWPWLRVASAWRWDDFINQENPRVGKSNRWGWIKAGVRSVDRLRRDSSVGRSDPSGQEYPDHPVDAVFWESASNRRFKVDGRYYTVFSDPIRELLDEHGLRSFAYESDREGCYRLPRYRPSFPCYGRFYGLGLVNRLRPRFTEQDVLSLPGFAEFQAFLSEQPLERPAYTSVEIARCMSFLRRVADQFRGDFKRLRPRIALMYGYYDWEAMSLCQACQEDGVASIDVQHGVQSRSHPAYARWKAVPPGGYGLMPDVFWTWQEEDAEVIREWSRLCAPAHRAIVGGNLGLEIFHAGDHPLARGFDEMIRQAIPRGAGLRVLLALQYGRRISDLMREIVRESSPDWCWLVRLHPNDAGRVEEFEDAFRGIRSQGIHVRAATELPLPAILRNVDAVATEGSSVVIEAEAFGVGSVILDRYSECYFLSSIQKGTAIVADRGSEALGAINRLASQRRDTGARSFQPSRAVLDLLRGGGPASVSGG